MFLKAISTQITLSEKNTETKIRSYHNVLVATMHKGVQAIMSSVMYGEAKLKHKGQLSSLID